jgi:uncharacterized protein YceK
MKFLVSAIAVLILISGCSSQKYWVKPGTGFRQTGTDLAACRVAADQGGQKAFSGFQLEAPCMVGKGYNLSDHPPSTE